MMNYEYLKFVILIVTQTKCSFSLWILVFGTLFYIFKVQCSKIKEFTVVQFSNMSVLVTIEVML